MSITTPRPKDRAQATLLHRGSETQVRIRLFAKWLLRKDRLNDVVATAFYADLWPRRTVFRQLYVLPTSRDRPCLFVSCSDAINGSRVKLHTAFPRADKPMPVLMTSGLTAIDNDYEFEEATRTICRVMEGQHPGDALLTGLISPELRQHFDSAECQRRVDCAADRLATSDDSPNALCSPRDPKDNQ